jgi:hypothetical protein
VQNISKFTLAFAGTIWLAVVAVIAECNLQAAYGQYAPSACWASTASTTRDGWAGRQVLPDAPGEEIALIAPRAPATNALAGAGGRQAFDVEPAVTVHQDPFSRVGIGVGISPLGVGVSSGIVLTEIFDARLSGNYFAYNNGRIDVDGFNVYGGLHLASAAGSVDFYPFNAPVRLSAGLMFYNTNHAAATMRIAPGTSFTMNAETFYAGGANSVPLEGAAELAFHSIRPAPTLTFGFGKFIPRSNRHWSFPSEFGVAFTGSPSLNVSMSGTVCTDAGLTDCANAASTSSSVGAEFNSALQMKLASWRRSLDRVPFFPIFSGGVSYSFDTPWQMTPKAKF